MSLLEIRCFVAVALVMVCGSGLRRGARHPAKRPFVSFLACKVAPLLPKCSLTQLPTPLLTRLLLDLPMCLLPFPGNAYELSPLPGMNYPPCPHTQLAHPQPLRHLARRTRHAQGGPGAAGQVLCQVHNEGALGRHSGIPKPCHWLIAMQAEECAHCE